MSPTELLWYAADVAAIAVALLARTIRLRRTTKDTRSTTT